MKFYEKFKPTIIVTLLAIIFLGYSCGKDSDDPPNDDNSNDNEEIIENYKLLKKITYTDFWWGEMNLDFSYSNGLLVKENNGGELVYYEYNIDNKISLAKECSDQNLTDINIDSYDCSAFYQPSTYIYENGKLKTFGPDVKDITFNYDTKGNLISEVSTASMSESIYYTYDNEGNILSKEITDGSSGFTTTFEYDGKKNPFYGLWKKFGYFEDQGFEPYDLVSSIFKQNATKIFKNNKLELEANYTYDSDGYPISCGFIEYLNDGTTREGNVLFTYLE